ncbi:MAG: DNA-protecting protein DprA [Bacteroidia bacterium]|nr:DNA-protecting protein DprA [Bacteroidia bacterium]
MDNDLVYKIALTQISGIGSVLAKSLIGYCGGAKQIFSKSESFLQKAPGVGSLIARNVKAFNDFSQAEKEVEFIEKNNIKPLFFLDRDYPVRLKNIPDCPILLYTKGEANLSPQKCIAIVGTRKMTEYGKQFTRQLVEDLVPHDVTVVSGLAYGVDIWAHKECLKNNVKTLGVVAHGLDRLYPALHAKIAKDMIAKEGAIVTEFISGTIPDRENFPKRNRIVAGMVDAVIVIESAKKGGSLITAELANQYNRDVMAVPGNVGNTYSEGCNYLIKNHKANVIESANDLVRLMNWDVVIEKKSQSRLFVELNDNEEVLMGLIRQSGEIGVDQLMANSGFSSSTLAVTLLELEMKNCLTTLPGKRYQAL